MHTDSPATLAVEDHGIANVVRMLEDRDVTDDAIEAAIQWTAEQYRPICLGVFTIPTSCN